MAKANGEGTVRKNEQRGRWEGRVTTDYDPVTRKTKRVTVTGKTRAEVLEKMKERQRHRRRRPGLDRPRPICARV